VTKYLRTSYTGARPGQDISDKARSAPPIICGPSPAVCGGFRSSIASRWSLDMLEKILQPMGKQRHSLATTAPRHIQEVIYRLPGLARDNWDFKQLGRGE
jgi:hypothetical protein